MIYVLIGAVGFLLVYTLDWLSLKNVPAIKRLVGVMTACLLIYATVMVCISPPKLDLPIIILPLGICLALVSFLLLIYSLFIEIPFHSTYVEKGVGTRLITTGTYALTRHPGVLWLGLFYISLALIFPSTTMFIAIIVWLIMDVILVILQDSIFFPRMFPGYDNYKKRTPFLIPTRQSISACLKTIHARK